MSVKFSFEIQGLGDGEPIGLSTCGPGHGLGGGVASGTSLGDPEDPPRQSPEDTAADGSPAIGDPEDPPRQSPEDTGGGEALAGLRAGGLCRPRVDHLGGRREANVDVGVPPPARRYSGFVILRLSDLVPVKPPSPGDSSAGTERRLGELAERLGLSGLRNVLRRFGDPPSNRAITTDNATAPGPGCAAAGEPGYAPAGDCDTFVSLSDLERRAAASELAPRRSLWSYFRLDARDLTILGADGEEVTAESGIPFSEAEMSERLIAQLNDLSAVDLAYRELAASDPSSESPAPALVSSSTEELSDFQIYLGRYGLDALWAQEQASRAPSATGNGLRGVGLADLEQGWIPGHQDLAAGGAPGDGRLPLRHGNNRHESPTYRGDHGTAVVGELIADAGNDVGVVGIVNGGAGITLASHYLEADPTGPVEATREETRPSNGHVADAVTALMTGSDPLRAGDVLLLEVQRGGQPTEIEPLDFDAIRLASAIGVTVIEAAGNGGLDLDRLRTVDGRSLDRGSVRFRDSGAIFVGASRPAAPFERASFSNFGSRLDCFGWGGGVVTAGYGDFLDGEDRALYTDSFSGTSSAAPMIAGAAVLVQTAYRTNAAPEAIPDGRDPESWRRLSPAELRALLADPRNGTRQGGRVSGFIGHLPNLRKILDQTLGIVGRVYLRDHEGDTGELPYRRRECASPDVELRDRPDGGKTVSLALRNRGLGEASVTCITAYRAPVSTLVTFDRWQKIGEIRDILGVHQGDQPVMAEIPAPDLEQDACLVATVEYVGSPEVPRPCPVSHFDWRSFLTLLRTRSDFALRNVHHVDPSRRFSFRVNGAPDAPRAFELQVIQRLPANVTVRLQAQLGLALKLRRGRLWQVRREGGDTATLYLPRQPRFRLGVVRLPPAVDFPCSFKLAGDAASELGDCGDYSLAIRQLYRGQEVGRITWYFRRRAVRDRAPIPRALPG